MADVPSEIKSIFRSVFEFYRKYQNPPDYMNANGWIQADEDMLHAMEPFEESPNRDFAKALHFAVLDDIQRRSRLQYKTQESAERTHNG